MMLWANINPVRLSNGWGFGTDECGGMRPCKQIAFVKSGENWQNAVPSASDETAQVSRGVVLTSFHQLDPSPQWWEAVSRPESLSVL